MINKKLKKLKMPKISTMIGRSTTIVGDIKFVGGLHIDGCIKGNIIANDDDGGELSGVTLSDWGEIEGEIRVPNIIINGTVNGDVYAAGRIELAERARITGDVYYYLLEMAIGAEVNGNLVHKEEAPILALENNSETATEIEKVADS